MEKGCGKFCRRLLGWSGRQPRDDEMSQRAGMDSPIDDFILLSRLFAVVDSKRNFNFGG
jgi:hypothetical protein